MPKTCPKCGVINKADRSTCLACGAELEISLFAEMFGPPRRLKDRYVVQRPAKLGATISLYHAVDSKEGDRPCLVHQVALTSLPLDRRDVVEHRFLQKADLWQKCLHPNLLRILDADVQHHRLYLITDPITGASLRSIILDRRQTVAEETLLHWAGQLCDVLGYLHSQDPPMIVGCLSPSAIHIDQVGQLQITEVGLVRYRQGGLIGPVIGIRGYAAPEQRQGETTPQSDLYTAGIIFYQLITRADPRERPLPSLHKYARGFSAPVLDAVAKAYRRDPEKRYASAAEMREALLASSGRAPIPLLAFRLAEGLVVDTISGLIQACIENWDEGLLALMTGRIADWLGESLDALHRESPEADTAQLESLVERTIHVREQLEHSRSQPGITALAREVAYNAAYASWMQDMGALGFQPSLEFHPSRFDFGTIGARLKAVSSIRIRNRGQGYLTGRVESGLPWIAIPDPVFGCRAGEDVDVRVEALGRRLPRGDSTSPQAIRIMSNGGDAWIEAAASSSPPVLRVGPQTLGFGPITRGALRVEHLTVTNIGGGRLTGLIVSCAPWLRVRHPNFSCPAGASAQIPVELLSKDLPEHAVRIRRALAIDSDSGQAQIDVSWVWARPTLDLDTTGVDLGSVERGIRLQHTLTLTNNGTAALVGESSSSLAWLTVLPARFQCAPGTTQELTIVCDTASLPGGSTVEPDAITIRANAGTQTISASVEVLAPRLVIEPAAIDFGEVRDGDQVEETIMVGNRGSMLWQGRVASSVTWLSVEPEEVSCDPGHFIPVTVLAHPEALSAGGTYAQEAALQIQGLGETCTVGVRLHLLRPELFVERHSLDVGLIGRTDIVTLPLEITNRGTGQLEWDIAVQGTWLEVIPAAGTCGPGDTASAQIKAYALAVDGDSGQAWLTVRSNGGRVDLPASVSLSSPLLAVEPMLLELQSENYAPTSRAIQVSNRGVGDLTGTVEPQVVWLVCRPTSFSCATGVATQIEVVAQLGDLREGTCEALDAIRIVTNGGSETIEARLTLALTPQLHVPTRTLHLGESTQAALQIENQGYGTLRIQVIPQEEWIAVNRRAWTIKGQKRAQVQVRLVDPPSNARGTIDIRSSNRVVRVMVQSPSEKPEAP